MIGVIVALIVCCIVARTNARRRQRAEYVQHEIKTAQQMAGEANEMQGKATGDMNIYTSPRHPHPMQQKSFTAIYGVHSCEGCGNAIVGIGYRCMQGCDYDLCSTVRLARARVARQSTAWRGVAACL